MHQLDPSLALAVADVIREQIATVTANFATERKALEDTLADVSARLTAMPGAFALEIAELTKRLDSIPAGEKGEKGEDGLHGTDGKDGVPGERGPPGERGLDGHDGKDAEPLSIDEIQPVIDLAVKQAVSALPPPKDGVDGKDGYAPTMQDIWPLISDHVDKKFESIPIPQDGKDGTPGIDGKDGRDGIDGKSITADEVRSMVGEVFATVPLPKDGKDGRDGLDGKSITVEDIRGLIEAEYAKWALEIERRGMDLIQRMVDRIPPPKDGVDGKDGRDGVNGKDGIDGLGFDDMAFAYDGERALEFRFERGDYVKSYPLKIPMPIYRGVFKATTEYEPGDEVTWGGSVWIAQRANPGKPNEGDGWKLVVKCGRDGKDGTNGAKGDKGDPGPRGRDLTSRGFDGSKF